MNDKQTKYQTIYLNEDYAVDQCLKKCQVIQEDGYMICEIVWITPREIQVFIVKRDRS